MIKLIAVILICGLSTALPGNAIADTADSFYRQGVESFKQQKYQEAVNSFLKAKNAGSTNVNLDYNIGVCYYRLGKYNKSKKIFTRLSGNSEMKKAAYYNLGLIANKQGDRQQAVHFFNQSAKAPGNSKLTGVANAMLLKLGVKPAHKENQVSGGVVMTYGHDDNVTLASTQSPTSQTDTYLDVFAFIDLPVSQHLSMSGNILWLNYSDIDSADFSRVSGAIKYKTSLGNWSLQPSIGIATSKINNNNYQQVSDFKLSVSKKIGKDQQLKLRYRYSDIKSDNIIYDYLEGSRQQFRASYYTSSTLGKLRLRYQHETNDRENTPTENFSPTRNLFNARLKQQLANNWSTTEEVEFRNSDYEETAGIQRSDDRTRIRLVLDRRINPDLTTGIRYTRTDNDSNIASENYTRNNIQVYADYKF